MSNFDAIDAGSNQSYKEQVVEEVQVLSPVIEELKYAGLAPQQMERVVKYVKKLKAAHKTQVRNLKVVVTQRAHEWMISQSNIILEQFKNETSVLVKQFTDYRDKMMKETQKFEHLASNTQYLEKLVNEQASILDAQYGIQKTAMPKLVTVEAKQSNVRGLFSLPEEAGLETNFGSPMRLYDNLKLSYPQSQVLELMRAQAEVKVLKTEN